MSRPRRSRALLGLTAAAVLVAGAASLTVGPLADETGPVLDEIGLSVSTPTPSGNFIPAPIPTEQLLGVGAAMLVDGSQPWELVVTADHTGADPTYAPCQQSRFADPFNFAAWLRVFRPEPTVLPAPAVPDPVVDSAALAADGGWSGPSLTQVLEVTESAGQAEFAFATMRDWYGTCEAPGISVPAVYEVSGAGDQAVIVVLRHSEPTPTGSRYTIVGIAATGAAVTTVIHDTAIADATGGSGLPDVVPLAQTLAQATAELCEAYDGACAGPVEVREVPPPPHDSSPEFLAVSDLPAVPGADGAWAAALPRPLSGPVGSVCNEAQFGPILSANVRSYTAPRATTLPPSFGIDEVVAHYPSPVEATAALEGMRQAMAVCGADRLGTDLRPVTDALPEGLAGSVWDLRFEVSADDDFAARVGVVQNGSALAYVVMSGFEQNDVGDDSFVRLVHRAGQRLAQAAGPDPGP